jgi:hypothetical protein
MQLCSQLHGQDSVHFNESRFATGFFNGGANAANEGINSGQSIGQSLQLYKLQFVVRDGRWPSAKHDD